MSCSSPIQTSCNKMQTLRYQSSKYYLGRGSKLRNETPWSLRLHKVNFYLYLRDELLLTLVVNPASSPDTQVVGHAHTSHDEHQQDGDHQADLPHHRLFFFFFFICGERETKQCSVCVVNEWKSRSDQARCPPCSWTEWGSGLMSKVSSSSTSIWSAIPAGLSGHGLSSTDIDGTSAKSNWRGSSAVIHMSGMNRWTPGEVYNVRRMIQREPMFSVFCHNDPTFI